MTKLKLGIIGSSPGNGHPYSWSAIFNGYDKSLMNDCPFDVIPKYLNEKDFPIDYLNKYAEVKYIYTQDYNMSKQIAEASKISNIVDNPEDLIGKVDAILLARDDAENHYKMSKIFIEAGLPIYIDKPLAFSRAEAKKIFELQKYSGQVYSCSALRFADELILSEKDKEFIGELKHIEVSIPNDWKKYSVHIIEPIISQFENIGNFIKIIPFFKDGINHCLVEWKEFSAYIKTTGNIPSSLNYRFFGSKNFIDKPFLDTFNCFKKSLKNFVNIINGKSRNIPENETLQIISLIEKGL